MKTMVYNGENSTTKQGQLNPLRLNQKDEKSVEYNVYKSELLINSKINCKEINKSLKQLANNRTFSMRTSLVRKIKNLLVIQPKNSRNSK